ncbi:5'-flap endonuclease [Oleoguttula sp. CCFEE 5521]
MAACSPISVRFSPAAQLHQVYSVQPESLSRKSSSGSNVEICSPGLPSPSAFVQPRAKQTLKGGSNAQQVPDGAQMGFTIARSLHTLLATVGDKEEDGIAVVREQGAKGKGKLVRPRKNSRILGEVAESSVSPRLAAFAHAEAQYRGTRSPHGPSALRKSTTPSVHAASPGRSRTPSISLSEFSFNGNAALAVVSPTQLALPIKKSRKKTESKFGTSVKPAATKKSRKPMAKSESIILNSDEPDEALIANNDDSVVPVPDLEGMSAEHVQHNEDSPRRPELSVGDFAFHTSALPNPIAPAEEIATTAKSRRKRTVAERDDDGKLVAKRSKITRTKLKTTDASVGSPAKSNVLAELSINTTVPLAMQVFENDVPKARKPRAKKVALPPSNPVTEGDATELLDKQAKPRKPRVRRTTEQSTYFASAAPAVTSDAGAAQLQHKPITDIAPEEEMNIFSQVNAELNQTLHEKPFAEFLGTLGCAPAAPTEEDFVGGHDLSELAPRRRRSWTPIHDRQHPLDVNSVESAEVTANPDANDTTDRVPMSELLHSFAYTGTDGQSVPSYQRVDSGEAQPKRRKVELDDSVKMPPPRARKRKSDTSKVDKPARKPKSPKKKPQTITALATAAYLPAVIPDIAQPTVSSYFDTVKPAAVPPILQAKTGEDEAAETTVKMKKPRKSRAKVPNADGTVASGAKVTKAKAEAKIQSKEADYRAPLCTPGKANAVIKKQDFLFGTSSQLAAQESPTFIREVQLAIRQSEIQSPQRSGRRSDTGGYDTQVITQMPGANGLTAKSYSRVPTAPHGTDLSILQAERELWCSGSRDYGGGMLEKELPSLTRLQLTETLHSETLSITEGDQATPQHPVTAAPDLPDVSRPVKATEITESTVKLAALEQAELPLLPSDPLDRLARQTNGSQSQDMQPSESRLSVEPVMIDLSYTSPIAEDSAVDLTELPKREVGISGSAQPLIAHDQDDNEWALLRSDNSLSSDILPDIPAAPSLRHSEFIARTSHSLTRQVPLPAPSRTALRPLDAKMGMQVADVLPKATSLSIARSLTSATAVVTTAMKKPRGRQRKDADVPHSEAATEPVKRASGRPRKNSTATHLVDMPASGLKSAAVPAFITSPSALRKQHSHPFTLSQPAEWANIDEISDLESPATPSSRRRRRATSSPPTIRPLEFSPPISPSIKASAGPPPVNLSNAALKPTDSEWLSEVPILFPKITATITTSPPSTDLKDPSWHEKILLYDPIVLEDLTAYLNSKGMRISVRRPKPKVKGKKKGEEKAAMNAEREWEVVEEELKGWMVQKWCEELSICCLWREGLRGGVKGNY